MKWKTKTAVVTGACGFIGSHLVEELVELGTKVKCLTLYDARGSMGWMDDVAPEIRSEVEIVAGDIRDAGMMSKLISKDDVVFHLAALIGIPYSYHAPSSYIETNINGTFNILEAARNNGASRVLVASTSEVYGTAVKVPIAEDHPLQAQSPYSASKIAAEKISESYYKAFDLPVTVMRPFNTYGPRQSARAVIPTILMQILDGRSEIRLGDPEPTRDFNYVKDTVAGMIALAGCKHAAGRVVNIGTGTEISIGDTVKTAANLLNGKITITSDNQRLRPEKSEVRRLCADNSLISTLTNWKPQTTLEKGLLLTIDWMKKGVGQYQPDRYYI